MPGEKHGEMIRLTWEGPPDALYIRGHVSDEEAMAEYERWHAPSDHRRGAIARVWARWSCEPGPDGVAQCFREYSAPGRGRFAVTRIDILAHAVDQYTWRVRHGLHSRREWCPPPSAACDCTEWMPWRCACDGACACHWAPRIGGVWRLAHEGGGAR